MITLGLYKGFIDGKMWIKKKGINWKFKEYLNCEKFDFVSEEMFGY